MTIDRHDEKVHIRITRGQRSLMGALVEPCSRDPRYAAQTRFNRTTIARIALSIGLETLRQRHLDSANIHDADL